MKKLTNVQIENFLSDLTTNNDIDILNCIDIDDINKDDPYYSIYEMIENNQGFDIDIIYYNIAIEYLKENDPSLMDSLEIATNYGYETGDLNSELLASLLASQKAKEEFSDLQDEIEDFFEEC